MKISSSRKARIEYLAIEKKAEDLFQKGHSFRSAYKIFYEANKITMSYDTFRRYALGLFTRMDQRRQKGMEPSGFSAPALECAKPSENQTASLPAQRSPVAANAPAGSGQENAPARRGPRVVGVKTRKFGQLDTDYDPLGLDKENQ